MDDSYLESLNFVAVDVETANPNMASICQIGIVVVEAGAVVEEWKTLVDPDDWFDDQCVSVHGIDEEDVRDAPVFRDIAPQILTLFKGRVVVSHTSYDRTSLRRAFAFSPESLEGIEWLDSSVVVRRVWSQFAKRGYGLASITGYLGIEFRHHDALEDARAAAEVVLRAAAESGVGLELLRDMVRRAPALRARTNDPEPNPDGPLFGEQVVFTGSLAVPRAEAKAVAAELGCEVKGGVTKKTTILVVGDQDTSKLAGKEKSSKHLKAEALIQQGVPIRVLVESDFFAMVESESAR
ncbi:3'-5' exoribonuclease [Microbulbifer salipaludis]|uniref:3'-5' exoribonuclease n=1 Tax=Microbulbifer salipaludis TaxID=187980 RepID=A0ABS3E983_9GAMM|nr:exonuclease domain-containing protein [Microbulbifer salipaludis]MBN8431831.1 3'-5' exoribonuclease [Microbulbifer salipaludis]